MNGLIRCPDPRPKSGILTHLEDYCGLIDFFYQFFYQPTDR